MASVTTGDPSLYDLIYAAILAVVAVLNYLHNKSVSGTATDAQEKAEVARRAVVDAKAAVGANKRVPDRKLAETVAAAELEHPTGEFAPVRPKGEQ